MLKAMHIGLAVIVVFLSVYSILTSKSNALIYLQYLMGLMLIIMGFSEIKRERKPMAITLFGIALFVLFVAVYTSF
ncbi:YczI family protein [Terribacillus saccharophilus]|uniref:YczI family protein n=1 Tax=Terribacillus saccharophilus TaxID=361277 RepID=UPI003982044C